MEDIMEDRDSSDVRILVDIVESEVDLSSIISEMIENSYRKGGGALAVFVGYVKGVVDGDFVEELEYTTYKPYAVKRMESIVKEEVEKGVHEVRVLHRIGRLKPGETTMYILVSGLSRKIVISSLERILERIKHEAPIYKLEKTRTGEYWVIGDKRVSRRATQRAQ